MPTSNVRVGRSCFASCVVYVCVFVYVCVCVYVYIYASTNPCIYMIFYLAYVYIS